MPALAIKAARLFDATGGPVVRDGVVLVDGERIRAVGPAPSVSLPPEAEVLDLGDQTVLPGLIDSHHHLAFRMDRGPSAPQLLQPESYLLLNAAANLRWKLRSGITTGRNLSEKYFIDVAIKRAVEEGTLPGPRLIIGTRGLRARHGHGHNGTPFDGVEELRKAVRENVAAGAQLTKFYVSGSVFTLSTEIDACYYSKKEIETIVDESHRAGIPVTVHCEAGPGFDLCLDAGVDSFEHGHSLTDEQIARLADSDAWLIETNGYLAVMDEKYLSPKAIERRDWALRESQRTLQKAIAAGVKWLIGTDNAPIASDLEAAVRFGVSPSEALQRVTRYAARMLGLSADLGTLKPGKLADIISVKGDPTVDISAMRHVDLVMQAGRPLQISDW